MSDSEIFMRPLRAARRVRALHHATKQEPLLVQLVSDDLLDRLSTINRQFQSVLICNAAATRLADHLGAGGAGVTLADHLPGTSHPILNFEEDRPTLNPQSYDLIISIGLLDSVNDLPGALVQFRQALKSDGLFLASFAGAGTLAMFKQSLREIEPNMQRIHPQIDVRASGDLLARAGFVMPVADVEDYPLRYKSLEGLMADIHAQGAGNLLIRQQPMRRAVAKALCARLKNGFDERLSIITLTGWAKA